MGWADGPSRPAPTAAAVTRQDAESCYRLLEEQMVPLYYTRDSRDIPLGWVERMRHALRLGGRRFTAHRMLADYSGSIICQRPAPTSREMPQPTD